MVFAVLAALGLLILFLAAFTGIATAESQRPKVRKQEPLYPNEGEQIGEFLVGAIIVGCLAIAFWHYVMIPLIQFVQSF